jgi:hypothetical protein
MESSKFVSLAHHQITIARQALEQFHQGNSCPGVMEGINLSIESLTNAQDSLKRVYAMMREQELIQRN